MTTALPTDADLAARFRPVFDGIALGAADRDRNRELPHEQIRQLRDAGFTALRVPVEHGGLGASVRQSFALLTDLATADPNLTQALRVHFSTVEGFLAAGDTEGLRRAGEGVIYGNAISEKGVGAVDRYQTRLTPTDNGNYQLNGTKFYSTGTLYADVVSVAADLDGRRVTVLVDSDAPGVHQFDDWDGFGQRLTGSGTTVFTAVPVAAGTVTEGGYGDAGHVIDTAYLQLFHLSALAGISRRAADDARDRVISRKRTFSHAPADLPREDPLIQAVLGRVYAAASVARAAVLAVADAVASSFGSPEDVALIDAAELAASEAQVALVPLVLDAVTEAFETGGASVVSEKLDLDRHWRNARTLAVHNPVVYKQQAVGRYHLTGDGLVFAWSAGVR
ncbi:acyl-CoA dehydrogenase family protein [uncultured Corynebacterium sp.]|uniref:acyl-CoA dehydrogenase family protein n=1 Tax=uncultured Corynebacterium sp. TaxID=159447 RepID=UPI0025E9B758|nr:acyl-CoA dehydrogenase family protein [uncultured Corynebacterium sp.]